MKNNKSQIAKIMMHDTLQALVAADEAELETVSKANKMLNDTLSRFADSRKKQEQIKFKIATLTRQLIDLENESVNHLLQGKTMVNEMLAQILADGESNSIEIAALIAPPTEDQQNETY